MSPPFVNAADEIIKTRKVTERLADTTAELLKRAEAAEARALAAEQRAEHSDQLARRAYLWGVAGVVSGVVGAAAAVAALLR